jgi:hypothetical protein
VLADRLLAFAMLFPFVLAGLWLGHRVISRCRARKCSPPSACC